MAMVTHPMVGMLAYVPTLVRLDGHIVTVVDSTASREQARAWALARRMLGPGVRAPVTR